MALSEPEREKAMKALAQKVMDFMWGNSAGDISRRLNWAFFIEALPHDHNLMELVSECFDAMSDDQKRQFLSRMSPQRTGTNEERWQLWEITTPPIVDHRHQGHIHVHEIQGLEETGEHAHQHPGELHTHAMTTDSD